MNVNLPTYKGIRPKKNKRLSLVNTNEDNDIHSFSPYVVYSQKPRSGSTSPGLLPINYSRSPSRPSSPLLFKTLNVDIN